VYGRAAAARLSRRWRPARGGRGAVVPSRCVGQPSDGEFRGFAGTFGLGPAVAVGDRLVASSGARLGAPPSIVSLLRMICRRPRRAAGDRLNAADEVDVIRVRRAWPIPFTVHRYPRTPRRSRSRVMERSPRPRAAPLAQYRHRDRALRKSAASPTLSTIVPCVRAPADALSLNAIGSVRGLWAPSGCLRSLCRHRHKPAPFI